MFATMDPRTVPCESVNRPRGTIDVHSGTTWHSPSCLHTLHSYVLTVCLNRPTKAATTYEFNASSSDARLRCEESPLVSFPQDGSSLYSKLHRRHHRVQELSTPAEPPVPPFQVTRGLQHSQQFSHFVVLFSNLVGLVGGGGIDKVCLSLTAGCFSGGCKSTLYLSLRK